jgi:carboxypeptidase family protein/TonB-dependent receptor-like protein
MKQSCVSAFARAARVFALAAVVLGFGAGSLLAQGTTGKLEGRVRDQAGAPIANAQVFIVGTAFNALTNPQGYYFINNVPAGTYNVRAAFIGYKSTQVDGVKMLAGQTITVDVQLEQTAVQIQEITVVTQTQPLVPRDEVTSKQRIDGEFTRNLPADRINTVLALQPGVVASPTSNTLSIRGGRTDEAVTYVDGVPVSPGFRGNGRFSSRGSTLGVSPGALEEASVTTGSSSAEFGNAQSGVIAINTRTGGSNYTGTLSFETDEPFGKGHSLGFNRIVGSAGGPIWRNLTFFVSGTLEGQQSVESGMNSADFPLFVQAGIDTTVTVPSAIGNPTADTTNVNVYNYAIFRGNCDTFKDAGAANDTAAAVQGIRNNYGVDCQGIRVPYSARSTYNISGKLNYTYGTGSRLSFSALGSQFQGRRFTENAEVVGRHLTCGDIYNPQMLEAFRNYDRAYILNWTQNLSKSSERALALETYLSYQQDRTLQGPMSREGELDTRDPFGGFMIKPMNFLFDFGNFPLSDQLVTNFRDNVPNSVRTPYDLSNPAQYAVVDNFRNNAYGLYDKDAVANLEFPESGGPSAATVKTGIVGKLIEYKENRAIGKANLDWQLDRYNRVKLGGEFTHYDIFSYAHDLDDQSFPDVYHEKPIRWNGFVEDRLDLGDVVVEGGVRYDMYDTRASRPYLLDTVSTSTTFGQYVPFPRTNSYSGTVAAGPLAGQELLQFRRDQKHDYLSPHIQVSFPVTERTNFRLSYAHQVQAPDFSVMLQGINTDLAITNTNHFYGSDLDFGRTITFEFGVRHAFSDDMVLDVAAYNKDNLSNAAGRLLSRYDPFRKNNQNIRYMTNADFGNTRGIDVRIDRRFGNLFNGTVSYTYQAAKNTGSDPDTYLDFGSRVLNAISGGNQPPPQAILPTDFSRPHTLSGAFSLNFPGGWHQGSTIGSILQNFGVFTLFRYTSGNPYTPCDPTVQGDADVVSGDNCDRFFPEPLNSARLPAFKQLDMRFTKGFGIGGLDITAYLDARNILNFRNIIQVFAAKGDITNSLESGPNWTADSLDLAGEASSQATSALNSDGSIALPTAHEDCATWVTAQGNPAAPNCMQLIRAEERYGNGDGTFDLTEQKRASDALYNVVRGSYNFLGQPRRMRLGFEVNF